MANNIAPPSLPNQIPNNEFETVIITPVKAKDKNPVNNAPINPEENANPKPSFRPKITTNKIMTTTISLSLLLTYFIHALLSNRQLQYTTFQAKKKKIPVILESFHFF
jgi:hypothetical protein